MKKRYRLLKEHRINRELMSVGAEVEMPEQLGVWLTGQGVLEPVVEAPVPAGDVTAVPAVAAFAPPSRTREPSEPSQPARWGCCSK